MAQRRRAQLGELERAVMDHLWSQTEEPPPTSGTADLTAGRPVPVRQVHDALASSREIAYTTVMTVLDRLSKKGLVAQLRNGRAYLYRPAVTRDQLTAELMHEALGSVDDGDRASALVRFVDTASPDDAAALRVALAEIEQREASE